MLFQRLQVLGDLAVAGKLTNIMLHRVPQVKGWEGVKHPCLNSKDVTKNGIFATFFLLQALAMPLKEPGWHEIACTFLSSKAQTKGPVHKRHAEIFLGIAKSHQQYASNNCHTIGSISIPNSAFLHFSRLPRCKLRLGLVQLGSAVEERWWTTKLLNEVPQGVGYWCCQLLHFRFPVSGEHRIFDVCKFQVCQANTPFSFGNLELEKWHRPQNNGQKRYGLRQQEQETYETWNNPEDREIDKPLKESFKKHLATCSCWTCKWEIPLSWQVWHVHECWLPGGYDKPLDIWQRSWRGSWTRSFANISMVDFTQIIFK